VQPEKDFRVANRDCVKENLTGDPQLLTHGPPASGGTWGVKRPSEWGQLGPSARKEIALRKSDSSAASDGPWPDGIGLWRKRSKISGT